MNSIEYLALSISLVGAIIAVWVSVRLTSSYNQRFEKRILKRDVLRRLCGYRHFLISGYKKTEGEPLIALNEIFIVFADSQQVLTVLMKFHKNRSNDTLSVLIKEMAKASEVPLTAVSDDFLMNPFLL